MAESREIKIHNFSSLFEQMCSMVAVGKTKTAIDTLMELILHCLVFLPDDEFSTADNFVNAIDGLFGIYIPSHEIQFGLDQLLSHGDLKKTPKEIIVLPGIIRSAIQARLDNAYDLEVRVRKYWQEEITKNYPILDMDRIWECLRQYLAKAFQRHGMQTAALLDPSIEITPEYSESLSSILDAVVSKSFPKEQLLLAKNAISNFMATTGNNPDRATYISQLADGAFVYFSLSIPATVSEQFRKNLNPLILFLDTNFLFGILDLTINPQVAVSNELLKSIEKYKFPFKLQCHQETIKELLSSIRHYKEKLSQSKWSQKISRAASTSRYLSGVELMYHQKFADTGIDVDSFFSPFLHADILLKKKNIVVYRNGENRLKERSLLITEYTEYLANKSKEKPYELIDHDMTVLDIVRHMKASSKSTLDTGALFITCDYSLYKFDWETSKKNGQTACTVLPNIFWQVLRPFIPSDIDFDRSFAATFAIPEFRIIGSNASEACSKMLSILAGYKDFPEDTASRMLSNDMLIEKLQTAENDKVFQEYVEAAIVEENATLLEEKAAISKRLDEIQREKNQKEKELREAREFYKNEKQKYENSLDKEQTARKAAEKQASSIKAESKKEKDKLQFNLNLLLSLVISVISIALFELLIFLLKWNWLLDHPNSIGLQAAFDILLLLVPLFIFVKKWRKIILGSMIIPSIIGIFSILGGIKK